ncbi:MAG: FG-GAP-like repeat-containing protein, partial [Verrucomicrobiota bacterium]
MLTVTRDQAQLKLYVDGELATTHADVDDQARGALPLTIGANNGDGPGFAGDLREVRIFDRALDDDEIRALVDALVTPDSLADEFFVRPVEPIVIDADRGVLANDVSRTRELSAELVTAPTRGTLQFRTDGSFEYHPSDDFVSGADTFTYRATDGTHTSNTTTVSLVISDPDDVRNLVIHEIHANPDNNADSAITQVALFDLSVEKTGPNGVMPNANFKYDLSVFNDGPGTAPEFVLTDTLPAGVSFVSASFGCVHSNGSVHCSVGQLAPGQSSSFEIWVSSSVNAGTLINQVAALPLPGDFNPANNVSTHETLVTTNFIVTDTEPANGESSGSRWNIVVEFNDHLDASTVNANTFKVHGEQSGYVSGFFSFPAINQVRFNPNQLFQHGEHIEVTLLDGIQSVSGKDLVPYTFTYTTEAFGCPIIDFEQAGTYSSWASQAVALGDMDGDSDLDAVSIVASGLLTIRWNNGLGAFSSQTDIPGLTAPRDLALGDMDGDGDLDIVVADHDADNAILLNGGAGLFTLQAIGAGPAESVSVELGDIDRDGDLDILSLYRNTPGGWIWLNDGTAAFTHNGIELGPFRKAAADLGDFDGDGDLDAFVAVEDRGERAWL